MPTPTLDQIAEVHFHWSESGLINKELRPDDDISDIEMTTDAAKADDLIRRAALLVDGGYDKTALTITLKDGSVWCREVKLYLTKRKVGLIPLISSEDD